MTYDDVLYELQKWTTNTGLDEAAQEAHQQFLGEVFFMFCRAFPFTEEQLTEFDEELHYQMGLVPATALQNFQSGASLDYELTPMKWDFQKYVEMGKVPVVVTFLTKRADRAERLKNEKHYSRKHRHFDSDCTRLRHRSRDRASVPQS